MLHATQACGQPPLGVCKLLQSGSNFNHVIPTDTGKRLFLQATSFQERGHGLKRRLTQKRTAALSASDQVGLSEDRGSRGDMTDMELACSDGATD